MAGIEYKDRIELLRSFLDGPAVPAGVDAVLEGLADAAGVGPPKKSRPSKESAALVSPGTAFDLDGGGLIPDVSVVFGLTGGDGTSSKRSTGAFDLGGGGIGWLEEDEPRSDDSLANLAFSWTILSGFETRSVIIQIHSSSPLTVLSSASSSNMPVIGSPSMAHRFFSYFVLIKFSIFLIVDQHLLALLNIILPYASEGTCPGSSLASQYLLAFVFPHANM